MARALVWFRRDLRLDDHLALDAAVRTGADILPVYIHGTQQLPQLNEGGASRWWLHHALEDLAGNLNDAGGALHIACGANVEEVLMEIVSEYDINAVYWNRRYQPEARALDGVLERRLSDQGVEVNIFNGDVLNEPHAVVNKSGKPYQVFTPYWKYCREMPVDSPCNVHLSHAQFVKSSGVELKDLELLPSHSWDGGFYQTWEPTREAAIARLKRFAENSAADYSECRDKLFENGTSRLSPYLHFGQIGVREIYHKLAGQGEVVMNGYIRQLYWRDFSYHLIYHFPHSVDRALKSEYEHFPWSYDEEKIERWRRGQTGFPIIDAAMRQLWQTGWMHNRARMVVGSFFVKHMLQHWQCGADWFWDTLVDADLANNTMGWQWVAGCGADAAPYFRVFNPLRQAERFDPKGDYVRKYVPELADIPGGAIHEPWELGGEELENYGVRIGDTYPDRMLDLNEGRERALEAYQQFKENREV